MKESLTRFTRALYFDIQSIDGVKPLEIWNGIREIGEPMERAALIKNLCKIVVPLVNEGRFEQPFTEQAQTVSRAVKALHDALAADPKSLVFDRFPDPPVRDEEQKELYQSLRGLASAALERIPVPPRRRAKSPAPDHLFDFRELRVADNELPYIIFTDKEFRVINGVVLVYLWIIDIQGIFLDLLAQTGVDPAVARKLESMAEEVLADHPLTVRGKKTEPQAFVARLSEKLKSGDYLDMFEGIYGWFEETRERLYPKAETGA